MKQRVNEVGSRTLLAAALVAAAAGLDKGVQAAQYASGNITWDDGATAAWSPTSGGPYSQLWTSGGDAIFEGSAGTVSVAAAGATAHNLTFNTTGYMITNNTLTLTGTTPTLALDTGLSATIASAIAGSSGMVKSGGGLVTLLGGNSCSGGTTVNGGTLQVGDGTVNGTLNGPYAIGAGATLKLNRATTIAINNAYTGAGTLALAVPDQAMDWGRAALNAAFTGKVVIAKGRLYGNSSGDLGGVTAIEVSDGGQFLTYPMGGTYKQTLSLSGNRALTGWEAGVFRIEGSTWSGPVHLLGNAVIANHPNSAAVISGVIDGPYNLELTKQTQNLTPNNALIFTASNTYSGATVLWNGSHLKLGDGTSGHDGSLNTSGITVNGSTLTYNLFGDQTVSYPITGTSCSLAKEGQGTLTLNNTGAVGFGNNGSSLSVLQGRLVYTNLTHATGLYQTAINIASNAVLEMNVDAGRNNCFGAWNSIYAGQGTLRKSGPGTLNIGSYFGSRSVNFESGALIDIQDGKLMNDHLFCNWQSNKASVAIASTATFDIRDDNVWIDSLLGAGTVLNSYGAKTLTLGVADGSGSFNGAIQNAGGSISLLKAGLGTQVLGGVNTYTGSTVVSNGALAVNGTLATASAVAVYTNATLGGTGTIGGLVTTAGGATLSPGDPLASDTIGTLTLSQSPTLSDGTKLRIDVSADGRCDLLNVQGNVDLSKLTLDVADVGLLNKQNTYPILTCTGTRQGMLSGNNLVGSWYVSYSDAATLRLVSRSGTIISIY